MSYIYMSRGSYSTYYDSYSTYYDQIYRRFYPGEAVGDRRVPEQVRVSPNCIKTCVCMPCLIERMRFPLVLT